MLDFSFLAFFLKDQKIAQVGVGMRRPESYLFLVTTEDQVFGPLGERKAESDRLDFVGANGACKSGLGNLDKQSNYNV